MTSMPASEARGALPSILDRVIAGEEITITRHGEPVAVVVRPDALVARRADRALGDAERIRDLLARARSRPLDAPVLSARRADDLVESVRSSRSAH